MLECSNTENSFSLIFKNRIIISHDKKNPAISHATGDGEITISHGMYHLKKDTISNRKSPLDFSIDKSDNGVTITFTGGIKLTVSEIGGRLHVSFACSDQSINRFWIHLNASESEKIYGCGEQFSRQNLRGSRLPLWTSEPGVGRSHDIVTIGANLHSGVGGSWHHTYFPQPTFISSENWYCHAEASAYSVFDFRKKNRHTLLFRQVPEKLVIGVCGSAPETIGSLSEFLGRQPMLPDWVYDGMWLAIQGGRKTVEEKVETALNAGLKLSAVWSQDWQGIRITKFGKQLFWNWESDENLYPGLTEMINNLNGKGIRFLGYNNPMLASDGAQFKEASAKGFLVKNREGNDYITYSTTFPIGIVDISNPEAREWFKNIIKEKMIGVGLNGWMADFGEYLPPDSVIHEGDACLYHNRFPAEWARLNYEAVKEAGKTGEIVFFTRSGFTGESRYSTLMWAGDQLVSFHKGQGFPTVVSAGLSAGVSGMGFFSFDIGGFLSIAYIKRSAELWMRSAEMAAFTQVMRSHEGINPKVNRQFDSSPELLAHLARMINVYVALKPYHKMLAGEYVSDGMPPMRHPWVHYEGDKKLHSLKYQYLYGRDLMVAPAYKIKQNTRKVYLPDDRWIHIWSGKEYGKGVHRVPAPIGKPAVFYRTDSPHAGLFQKIKDI